MNRASRAVGVGVAVLIAVTACASRGSGVDQVPSPPATSAAAGAVAGYPKRIVPPTSAIALPVDEPVGLGAFVYQRGVQGCCSTAFLVMPDGRQYSLNVDGLWQPEAIFAVTLSPDGRWLGIDSPDGYSLRDLTGTTTHRVGDIGYPGFEARAWSPNSRWLLLTARSGGPESRVVDVTAGTVTHAPRTTFGPLVGVLASGDFVRQAVCPSCSKPPTKLDLRIFHATTGVELGTRSIDVSHLFPPGEDIHYVASLRANATEMLVLTEPVSVSGDTHLLVVDATGGHRVSDHVLAHDFRWTLLEDAGTHLVLYKRGSLTHDEIVVMELATGQFEVATEVPPQSLVRGRGVPLAGVAA